MHSRVLVRCWINATRARLRRQHAYRYIKSCRDVTALPPLLPLYRAQSCACPLLDKCHKGQIKTSHAYRYIKSCRDVTPNLLFTLSMHSRVLVCMLHQKLISLRFHAQSCACPLLIKCHKGQIKTSHAYMYIKSCRDVTALNTLLPLRSCTVVCLPTAAPEVDLIS